MNEIENGKCRVLVVFGAREIRVALPRAQADVDLVEIERVA